MADLRNLKIGHYKQVISLLVGWILLAGCVTSPLGTRITPSATAFFSTPPLASITAKAGLPVTPTSTPTTTPTNTPTTTPTNTPTITPTKIMAPGRLSFVSDLGGYPGLYSINADGSGLTLVFDDLNGISAPAWSPDGSQIAFVADDRDRGHFDIFAVQADGTGLVNLTHSPDEDEMYPAWSPDGTHLAFISTSIWGNGRALIVMELSDSSRAQLTENSGRQDDSPAWSPDGKQLAFDRQPGDALPGIYLLTIGDSTVTRLTSPSLLASHPVWSPDGRQIVFNADTDQSGIDDIYIMNVDGSSLVNLTHTVRGEYNPTWSPDGKQIAFVAYNGDGVSGIYTISPAGGEPSLLFSLPSPIRDLNWGTAPNLLPTPTPSSPATLTPTPVPPSPDDGYQALQALIAFFDALHSGDYEQATQLYGGSYLLLIDSYPIHDPHDHAGLLARGCQSLLRRCMLAKSILWTSQKGNEFLFTVEFKLDDGSLFLLGPCCGGTGDPVSQFTYHVIRTSNGKFLVMDLPPYVP